MLKKLSFFILLQLLFLLPKAQDLRGDTIDLRSFNLKLDLSDFTTKVLRAEAVIGIKSKQNGVTGIQLDLLKLTVDSVKVNTSAVPFTYNDSVIAINLLLNLNTGDSATLQVFYHGNPYRAAGDFGGFYWTNAYAFNIGVSFLADPHTYGRVWFPCFDNFEQRSLYEFYVTTKNTHKAFCNGLLQDIATNGNKKIWHWKLTQDIPSYLASVAVSDYATVEDTVNGMTGTLQVQLAARAADTTNLKNLFVHLHDAFHIQEEAWGPYLWDRVGFCIVPFNAGAMEHATNIGFMTYYLNSLSSQAERTMAHELSHHWFGNLVTCKTAGEMWLNEGWASYNEHLFYERLYGDSTYKDAVRVNHEDVLHKAHISDGSYLPVSGVPTESTYGSTVYNKGADVIHTLRAYMGDQLFFSCVKNFLTDFAWQNITTIQLRDYLAQCAGINLNDYFNDFITAPGFTHFSIEQLRTLPTTNAGFQTTFV
ncbi:MAG: M1 family metallopeptidase, partial [Chitinophagales bacterium]|nr:M1 family metallopeptidase [Chitinophagales bacterium]